MCWIYVQKWTLSSFEFMYFTRASTSLLRVSLTIGVSMIIRTYSFKETIKETNFSQCCEIAKENWHEFIEASSKLFEFPLKHFKCLRILKELETHPKNLAFIWNAGPKAMVQLANNYKKRKWDKRCYSKNSERSIHYNQFENISFSKIV